MQTINWQEVITTLGGNAAFLAVGGWLIKTVISHGLTREAEAFKIQLRADADREIAALKIGLQARADTEIERLKNALQIVAEEHKVRFAKLHENQAQRIADLYERLAALTVACQRYVYELGESNRQAGFNDLEKKFSDLYLCFKTSRLYLPEHICVLLDNAIKTLREPGISVFVYSAINEYARHDVIKEKNEAIVAAVKAFETEIPATQKALTDEFRKMFGVEN